MKKEIIYETYENMLPAWAKIDLSQLKTNVKMIHGKLVKGTKLGAVVKADAYGHGAEQVVQTLKETGLISMLIVGKEKEAAQIKKTSGEIPVLILDRMEIPQIKQEKYQMYSAYDLDFLRELSKKGEAEQYRYCVQIRIDVLGGGMGMKPLEFLMHQEEIFSLEGIEIKGIYTHLYSGYQSIPEKTKQELEQFGEMISQIPKERRKELVVHAENSPLMFEFPEYQFDMVRSGTAIYGLPFHKEKDYGLQPLLSVKSRISSITEVEQDCLISYKKAEIPGKSTGKSRKIARFLLGYWDCPFLMLQMGVCVHINGKLYKIPEEPCMDQSCLEISGEETIGVGDEVTLIGQQPGVTIRDILKRHNIDFIHSERLCLLSERLERIYLDENPEIL